MKIVKKVVQIKICLQNISESDIIKEEDSNNSLGVIKLPFFSLICPLSFSWRGKHFFPLLIVASYYLFDICMKYSNRTCMKNSLILLTSVTFSLIIDYTYFDIEILFAHLNECCFSQGDTAEPVEFPYFSILDVEHSIQSRFIFRLLPCYHSSKHGNMIIAAQVRCQIVASIGSVVI